MILPIARSRRVVIRRHTCTAPVVVCGELVPACASRVRSRRDRPRQEELGDRRARRRTSRLALVLAAERAPGSPLSVVDDEKLTL